MKNRFMLVHLLFFFLLLAHPAFSQSAEIVDTLLSQEEASLDKSLYMILSGNGQIPEQSSPDSAMVIALEKGWIPEELNPDSPITLGIFGHSLIEAFNIPAGIMYSLFPGPRYGGRELVYRGWIGGSKDKNRKLTGSEVVTILRNALEWKELRS
jgi:hypothetical protein